MILYKVPDVPHLSSYLHQSATVDPRSTVGLQVEWPLYESMNKVMTTMLSQEQSLHVRVMSRVTTRPMAGQAKRLSGTRESGIA